MMRMNFAFSCYSYMGRAHCIAKYIESHTQWQRCRHSEGCEEMLNPSVKHRRVEGRRKTAEWKNIFIVSRRISHSVLFPVSSCYRTYSEPVAGSLGWREQHWDSLACLNYKWKNIINCNLCQFHLLSLSVHATATDASTINSLHLVITRIPLTRNPNSNVSSAYTTHISYRPHIWVRGEQREENK